MYSMAPVTNGGVNPQKPSPPMLPQQTLSEQEKVLQLSQISIWIDDYDDLFSDFDPRPYSQRAISDDFLSEAKKALKESPRGKFELRILIPARLRNPYHETIIKKRLRDHFKKQAKSDLIQKRDVIRLGLAFMSSGVALMLVTTYILFHYEETNFLATFLSVVFEPAGWFLFWEGMYLLIFRAKEKNPELEFNEKMAECNVYFQSY